MFYRYCWAIYLLLCVACTDILPQKTTAERQYFDLIGFFEREIAQLKGTTVQKSVTLNDQTELQTSQLTDWTNELSIFTASDINKPAFRDSYQIDSIWLADTLRISYTALNPKLRTQSLRIDQLRSTQSISHIAIDNRVKNPLYELSEVLHYAPARQYTISSRQKVRGLNASQLDIRAEIIAHR